MRISPLLAATCALWLVTTGPDPAVSQGPGGADPDEARPYADAYRADSLSPVPPGPPDQVQILPSPGAGPWPRRLTSEVEQRVLREWPGERIYGPIYSSLGVWLRYPLVTARVGGRVLVPAVDGSSLRIEGRVEAPPVAGRRSVVVLVDASASANALTALHGEDGVEYVSVLEAERRALEQLLELIGEEWLDVAVLAFGESTWTVAEPGSSRARLRRGLERFRREKPRGEGRTDLVCALWSASEWLEATPAGTQREIVVLTDGEMPHSGRFVDCDGPYMRRSPAARGACEARRNRSPCPAAARLDPGAGSSDLVHLASFARRAEGRVRVTPLVFDPAHAARPHEQLARRTGSRLVRVPSPGAVETALPALVSSRVRTVSARNLTSGAHADDLLVEGQDGRILGELPLLEGANDVELRIHSDRGAAGLFRFRIYAMPGHAERYLARLRSENAELARRSAELLGARGERQQQLARERRLDIELPASPAAP